MKKALLPLFLFIFTGSIFAQNQVPSATNATAGKLTVNFAIPDPNNDTHYCVYITNSANQLVHTLSYRYSDRGGYADQLTEMWNLIGKSFSVAKLKYVGSPDGFTGATFNAAQALKTVYWGNTAPMTATVAGLADGNYKINFELVKRNNNRDYTSATFVKGPAASTSTVTSPKNYFNNMSVNWAPANTAINDVELEKMYSVYPNPAISSIFVTGSDIQAVEICSLNGRSIFSCNEQKVNLSKLPKGFYLAVIRAKSGTIVKKIEKR